MHMCCYTSYMHIIIAKYNGAIRIEWMIFECKIESKIDVNSFRFLLHAVKCFMNLQTIYILKQGN